MKLGEKIKIFRTQKGYTQKQLGDLISSSEVVIGQYERGIRNPKIETKQKLAEALNIPIQQLLDLPTENSIHDSTFYSIEKKLELIGYSVGSHEEDAYIWINYPEGTLEVTEGDLRKLDDESTSYLKFKLEELKNRNIKDFRKKK